MILTLKKYFYKNKTIFFILIILFSIYYLNKKPPLSQKIIVFDLDETLGNFVELSIFSGALESFYRRDIDEENFYDLFALFPSNSPLL